MLASSVVIPPLDPIEPGDAHVERLSARPDVRASVGDRRQKAVQQKGVGSEQVRRDQNRDGRRAWRCLREPREYPPSPPPLSDLLAAIEHEMRRLAGNLGAMNQNETWRWRPQRTSMTLSPAPAKASIEDNNGASQRTRAAREQFPILSQMMVGPSG